MSTWEEYIKLNADIISAPGIHTKLNSLILRLMQIPKGELSLIFTAGNGGSATTADHFAADLSLTNKRVGYPIAAICLNSHLGLNTALSNDISYEFVFSEQLKNYKGGDHVVIIFSASGNSKNLLNLLSTATKMGIESWAFLGFNGGEIARMSGINTLVFSDYSHNYGVAENAHLVACHYVIEQINGALGRDV